MDHLPKFRRKPKNPTISTDAKPLPHAAEPETYPAPVLVPTISPGQKQGLRKSAFRSLHLRSATKRARSPPPAALPTSPPPAIVTHDGVIGHPPASPAVTKMSNGDATAKDLPGKKAKIPSFLTLSTADLERKFEDIVWMERNRIAFGSAPDADGDHRWATYKQTDMRRGVMDRYYNIKPWNHNRVKLRVASTELDYVNASMVQLESLSDTKLPPLRYIAMQGPTEASLDFVWRMIAEQLTTPVVIVQLTSMFENGAPKCFPYLPLNRAQASWTLNEDNVWNDEWEATLALEDIETLENGAIEVRKLKLQVKDEPTPRDVYHLLYTRWPDFGVPALADLDSFFTLMRLSREHNKADNPRVIHCSAGVGRTGTFITLEHLMRELEAGYLEDYDGDGEKEDLIFQTVDALREQRRSMVQADPQFLFIYQVLRKLWLDKYGQEEDGEGAEEPAAKRLEVGDPFVE